MRTRSLLFITLGISLFAAQGCTSCAGSALGLMPGVVNDPSNRALRQSILQFGMAQFCHQMLTHDAPLQLQAGTPAIGRFFPTSCQQQQLQNGDYFVQFAGYGYGYTPLSKKLTFTMSGAVEYDADFQLAGSTMYIYFRPRNVTSSNFQSHVIEQPVAQFLNQMSNLGDTFGKQIVASQLNQGFTVIRDSNGSADFAVGLVEVGKRPQHAVDVHGTDKVTWENARTEVHQNERDFLGPIEVTDSGRAIWVNATLDGAPAIDVLLVKKDVGDASLKYFFDYPQAGPLAGAPIGQILLQQGAPMSHAFPVDPGQYYVIFDNTPSAGGIAPPMNPLADVFGTVSYAIQLGDAP